MPRLKSPDPLALAVGERVRQLREELGLTQEKLAFESEIASKGHLSGLEHGLLRPTVHTLKALADRLGLPLLDLVTFPADDARQQLVDLTRNAPNGMIRKWTEEAKEALATGGKLGGADQTPRRRGRPRRPPR